MARTTDDTITRVTYRWDAPAGVEAGWYAESWAGGEMMDDSQKVWFPVAVDGYDRDQADELEGALRGAFPAAEIEYQG